LRLQVCEKETENLLMSDQCPSVCLSMIIVLYTSSHLRVYTIVINVMYYQFKYLLLFWSNYKQSYMCYYTF